MPQIRDLLGKIMPSETNDGDGEAGQINGTLTDKKAISAIIVSIQMIVEHCKRLKWHRRIVLVTDAQGEMDGEDNSEIAKRIADEGIELTVV
jgi:ATP-dependent DNA helicase 2 subunit 2